MFRYMDFIVYCIEEYKSAKKLTGRQVVCIFDKYKLYDFIDNDYDSLHTFGGNNIVWNIEDYISNNPNNL